MENSRDFALLSKGTHQKANGLCYDSMIFRRNHIQKLPDEALIKQYQARPEPVYLDVLFERYTDLVFLVCMKYLKDEAESQDLSMQIFEKLIGDLRHHEIRSFRFWLHTVTKNHCLAHLKRESKQRQYAEAYQQNFQEQHTLPARSGTEESWIQREETLQNLESAMDQLKEEQKICVELFYLKKKSYQEIANETGYSMKQVKSFIQNGKRNLKKHLTERKEAS